MYLLKLIQMILEVNNIQADQAIEKFVNYNLQ